MKRKLDRGYYVDSPGASKYYTTARSNYNKPGKYARTTQCTARGRTFIPRTMGPLAQSESKYFDSYLEGATLSETAAMSGKEVDPATLNTLFVPSEGSDIDNRIGRKVSVYKICVKGYITITGAESLSAVPAGQAVRVALVMDTQTNGTQLASEEVFEIAGSPTVVNNINAFQNKANFGRFKVVRDKIYNLDYASSFNAATTSTGAANMKPVKFKWTKKFKVPITVKFNGTNGGTIGDIVDNSFHLIAWSNSATFTKELSYMCRTYYKDY